MQRTCTQSGGVLIWTHRAILENSFTQSLVLSTVILIGYSKAPLTQKKLSDLPKGLIKWRYIAWRVQSSWRFRIICLVGRRRDSCERRRRGKPRLDSWLLWCTWASYSQGWCCKIGPETYIASKGLGRHPVLVISQHCRYCKVLRC